MSTEYRDSRLKIFLSSTMEELRDARDIVDRELDKRGIHAWVFENNVSASPNSITATSLQQVSEADVYIGLFWQRYGKVTIQEYEEARRTSKPCFIYIRDKGCKRDDNLETFLTKEIYDLQKGVTYRFFDRVSELAEQIAEDILAWLVRQHREMTAELLQAHVSQEEMLRLQTEITHLQAASREVLPRGTPLDYLAQQMRAWFQTLNYSFEHYEKRSQDSFTWIINVPHRRRYDRILIRGVEGEATIHHVIEMRNAVAEQRTDEGWVVAVRRVSQVARREVDNDKIVSCYTFDELLDLDADFSQYLDYLAREIQGRKIDTTYVPLACTKDEFDPSTRKKIASSLYNESNGWIEGYIDRWLTDPSKEHISVLGEFGTGKTWFTLHYAWVAMQRYLDARKRGVERPRLPLVIPLRDYAKAVSVESLFSEFFFRKYEIDLPGYSVFEQLNRMGKLLLIFDGFDEMADKVDRQKMINNFWELARTVVPGSKVILTCRTEHFPYATEGRALLNAELQASTASLTGEPPQFEVLELKQFDNNQVQKRLSFHTTPDIVQRVMNNPALVDLARRPVMIDLILEALPDIEAGKPVDMSRVYLYAIHRKMERDISDARTFTSLKDKLYFLCELSWEMLSTDQMSLNYRHFPDRIRKLFGPRVEEQKDLDHWHYDMMGQTMLIRNADGDYTPAHRSLLEFFVAYKFAAELGVLAPDFLPLAQKHLDPHATTELTDCSWSDYFRYQTSDKEDDNLSLRCFSPGTLEHLRDTIGKQRITRAVLDLMQKMLISDWEVIKDKLTNIILQTRGKTIEEVGFISANIVALLFHSDPHVFVGRDLSGANLAYTKFQQVNLENCNLSGTNLQQCLFFGPQMKQVDLRNTDLTNASFHENNELGFIAISPDGLLIATGGTQGLINIWATKTDWAFPVGNRYDDAIPDIFFSADGKTIGASGPNNGVQIYDLENKQVLHKIHDEEMVLNLALHKNNLAIAHEGGDITIWDLSTNPASLTATFSLNHSAAHSILFHARDNLYIAGGRDGTITLWDFEKKEIVSQKKSTSGIYELCLSPDKILLAVGAYDNGLLLLHIHDLSKVWHLKKIGLINNPVFTSTGEWIFAGSYKVGVVAVLAQAGIYVTTFSTDIIGEVAISPDDTFLVNGSNEGDIQFWDIRPFVTVNDEPHIPLLGYSLVDLSPYFQDISMWPEWWQKCQGQLPIPPDMIPNPNFGRCVRTIRDHMNCQGLRLAGAKGLGTIRINDSKKGNIEKNIAWFAERGAIVQEEEG
jgi:WD40 repeat protein